MEEKTKEKKTAAEKKKAADAKMAELKDKRRPKAKGTVVSLTVKDRLVMRNLFPKETNLLTQILIRDMTEKVQLNQKDLDDIDFTVVGTGYKWDEDKAKDIEVSFTDAELKILSDAVNELDKKNKVTQELLDICMKIKNN